MKELGGAKEIYACASHGVLSGPAIERIEKSAINEVLFLDTIPENPEHTCGKIKYISAGELFAEAIRRICDGSSMASLFY